MSVTRIGPYTQGEIPLPLAIEFRDGDNQPIDASGYEARVQIRRFEGATFTRAATVDDDGQVVYVWQAADLEYAGNYELEAWIGDADVRLASRLFRFRARKAIEVPDFGGPTPPLPPTGTVRVMWRGAWVSGGQYLKGDAVSYDGSTWACLVDVTSATTPDNDATHWVLVAKRGDKGDQGEAATVDVGTTTTVPAGTPPSVTNGGTTSAAILDFALPDGPPPQPWQAMAITGAGNSGTLRCRAEGANGRISGSVVIAVAGAFSHVPAGLEPYGTVFPLAAVSGGSPSNLMLDDTGALTAFAPGTYFIEWTYPTD